MVVSQIVEHALKQWPSTRDSDRKLILAVWWLQDNDYESHFREFFKAKAIMPETITRCRRKFQEQGKYRASEAVEEDRYNKFKEARGTAGQSVTEIVNELWP